MTKASAAFAWPVIRSFRNRIDHRRYNGAVLIGLRGIVFKSHGSSDAFAFEQALRRAYDAARNDLIGNIAAALPRQPAAGGDGEHATPPASVHNRAMQVNRG